MGAWNSSLGLFLRCLVAIWTSLSTGSHQVTSASTPQLGEWSLGSSRVCRGTGQGHLQTGALWHLLI